MQTVTPSLLSSRNTLVPPETRSTTGVPLDGSTDERRTPRVSISVSA